MNKVLVVYAHPKTGDHCRRILERVEDGLKRKNVKFEVLDLYSLKYDPVLKAEEHYTSGNRKVSRQNLEFQRKVSEADRLIFIYPVWWSSMPAILKGWFDRVFTARYAYRFVKKPWFFMAVPVGLLKGKRAAIFMSSGSGKLVMDFYFVGRAKKIISKDILGFCGIKSKAFQIGNANRINKRQERKIDVEVKRGLRWLGFD